MEPSAHDEPGKRDLPSQERRVERELTDADADPVLGGADAVEKTTYLADVHGSEVEEREVRRVGITASVPSGGATPIAWIAGILALLALVAYAAALFS